MKDKYTYDLIEGINGLENLDIDFDKLISEEELENVEVDTKKIKNKTYEKIGKSKINKYKYKKLVNIAASIAIIALIGTPVALAFVNQLYKYDKTSGRIIKSEVPLYILKDPITKKVGDGEISITSFVVNPSEGSVEVNEESKNIRGFDYYKRDIRVDGQNITDTTFDDIGSSSWSSNTGTYFEYKEGNKFEYVVSLMGTNKKITEIKFDIELEKASSVEEYNKDISKDTNNNVVISAITKEEDNTIQAELMAIPNVEKFDFTVDTYGNHINTGKGSGIYLVDANGKKVEGSYIENDNKNNVFNFDITNMKKPYTIEINQIQVSTDKENVKGKNIKFPKLKLNEAKEYNRTIDLEDKNNILTKESHNMLIKKIERKNINNIDTYILHVDYPDNKNANKKLQYINSMQYENWIGITSFNYSSCSQDALKNETSAVLKYDLQEINNKTKEKPQGLKINISPDTYIVQGKWKININ
ncbi:MAG: hypothetical protein ACRDA3_11025 [Peptostreptococcaceae bacterium]